MALRFTKDLAPHVNGMAVAVDSSDLNDLWSGGASASLWLHVDTTGAGGGGSVYLFQDGWSIQQHGTRIRLNHSFTTTEGRWYTWNGLVPLGEWTHCVFTYDSDSDSNDALIYINGVPENVTELQTPSGTAVDSVEPELSIGNNRLHTRPLDGLMADVCLWDRIISAGEVAEIFHQAGLSVPLDGLVRRYKMSPLVSGVMPGTPCSNSGRTIVSSATSIDVDVPTHVDGDTLLIVVAAGGLSGTAPNITTPSGWTHVATVDCPTGGTTPSMSMYIKVSDSEGSTVNVTSDIGAQAWFGYMLAMGDMTTTVDTSATATGTSTSPNSPTVTPSAGAVLIKAVVTDAGNSWETPPWDSYPPNTSVININDSSGLSMAVAIDTNGDSASGSTIWTTQNSQPWGGITAAFVHGHGGHGAMVKDYSPNPVDAIIRTTLTGDDDILNAKG